MCLKYSIGQKVVQEITKCYSGKSYKKRKKVFQLFLYLLYSRILACRLLFVVYIVYRFLISPISDEI